MRSVTRTAVFLIVGLLISVPAQAVEPVFSADGAAIHGYDPVAYFTDDKPVKGDPAHSATYQGATWHFASAENRDIFTTEPEKFAPPNMVATARGPSPTTAPPPPIPTPGRSGTASCI